MLTFISYILVYSEVKVMKYYTIHEVSKILGVSAQTLRNWDKLGKLKPNHKSPNGYRYYSENDLNALLNVKSQTGKTVGYCRVSSPKQREDLVQIITVFSCKLQGKRANKAKRMIKELTENDKSD